MNIDVLTDFQAFIALFDAIDLTVISINLLLMIFARRIMQAVDRSIESELKLKRRVQIFRLFNLAIIVAFSYYHLAVPANDNGPAFKLLASITLLYFAFLSIHLLSGYIHSRYGKTKLLDDKKVISETYNSRLISIIASTLLTVIFIIAIIRLLGFDSWLEAGGVIGILGVLLALTQSVWAPDLFSGLILLNSGMLETGDVIEIQTPAGAELAMVYKTRLFYTELLNLVNNHRLMIRNAVLRDLIIHNLSRFASAKGLREKLLFKIGYDVPLDKVKKMMSTAYAQVVANKELSVEESHGLEVKTVNAGDYAIEYAVFYYTKDVKNLLRNRYGMIEAILQQARQEQVALYTPQLVSADLHQPH